MPFQANLFCCSYFLPPLWSGPSRSGAASLKPAVAGGKPGVYAGNCETLMTPLRKERLFYWPSWGVLAMKLISVIRLAGL
jgi:hypothetical protein